MNKICLLFSILFLCYKTINAENDCSDFELIKKQQCESITYSDYHCMYSDNKCIESYTTCTQYNPQSNFVDSTCKEIIPNWQQKCIVEIQADGTKKCVVADRECKDHTINDSCVNLKADNDKRCVLINDKCIEHSDRCNDLTKEECEENIPIIREREAFGK